MLTFITDLPSEDGRGHGLTMLQDAAIHRTLHLFEPPSPPDQVRADRTFSPMISNTTLNNLLGFVAASTGRYSEAHTPPLLGCTRGDNMSWSAEWIGHGFLVEYGPKVRVSRSVGRSLSLLTAKHLGLGVYPWATRSR